MLGDIKIYFGKVVSITDDKLIYRCRISINGYTETLKTDERPWYFPWYGVEYLPELNDVVPVIVFDDNFATAFYGKKVLNIKSELSEDDYPTYLELYKRLVDDKQVNITYTKSKGIELFNDKGKLQIELEQVTIFCGVNSILITEDKINIGNEAKEASLLGDKSVTELHDIIKHQANVITELYTMMNAISSACVTPFTAPIKAALTPLIASGKTKLESENKKVDSGADKIQSKKVYIE